MLCARDLLNAHLSNFTPSPHLSVGLYHHDPGPHLTVAVAAVDVNIVQHRSASAPRSLRNTGGGDTRVPEDSNEDTTDVDEFQ